MSVLRWFVAGSLLAIACLAPAGAQPLDAGEPALILPDIVLRIEDLTVENVIAGLPAEGELLPPPLRVPPLPALQEPAVRDVEPPIAAAGEPGAAPAGAGGLSAEAVVGAGTLSHTYGRVGVYRTGEGPRFSLRFLHDMEDGLGGEDPGSGFHQREDRLDADVRLRGDRLEVDSQAQFSDSERGLQEQGPYYARTLRDLNGSVDLTYALTDRLALTGALAVDYASDLLSGSSDPLVESRRDSESSLAPRIGLRYKVEGFEAALVGGYTYTVGIEELQRVRVDASASWDPSERVGLKAQAGWYWSDPIGSLLPFQVSFSAAFSPITLDASAGYRVTQLDWGKLLAIHPFADITSDPEDDRGWFADGRLAIAIATGLSLQTRLEWQLEEAMPDPALLPGDALDGAGLFVFSQTRADRLRGSAGLRWNPKPMLGLTAAVDAELFERPTLDPRYVLRLEAEVSQPSGAWGASAAARLELESEGDPSGTAVPFVDAGAFWRVSAPVTLSLEGGDLFAWLVDGPRYRSYPFIEPGTSVILKVQINL